MKTIRIIFVILSVIWMIAVFYFSKEPSNVSSNTSSSVTKKIITIITRENLSEEEISNKVEGLDPIIRKLAHYTLYLLGGVFLSVVLYTYDKSIWQKIIISQSIGSIYSVTDEIHQYFVPRKKL